MIEFFTQGVGLGFNAGVGPGPFQTFTINSALTLGWRKAVALCFAPILTDIPLIVLVVFVLGSIPPAAIRALQVVGGCFLLWIAWGIWQQWRTGAQIGAASGAASGAAAAPASSITTAWQVLRRGMLMNLLSPGPYLFWGTVTGPLLISALKLSAWHGGAFLVGFYGTFMGFIALTVLLFDRLRSLDPRLIRGILLATMIVLLVFALNLIRQGLTG